MTVNSPMPEQGTETPEFQRLLDACLVVSEEAYSLGEIGRVVSERLPRLSATLKEAFRFITTWDYSRPEVLNAMSVSGVLRKAMYTELDVLTVAKPLGFTGNLYEYSEELRLHRLDQMCGIIKHVLKPTQDRFARYLNAPEDLGELQLEPSSVWGLDTLKASIEAERKWVTEGNRSTDDSFTQLYHNNKQCVSAMHNLNEVNKKRWAGASPKHVAKETELLVKLAQRVFKEIQGNAKVSKQVLSTLASELELAGRWVEWYSVQVTQVISVTTALKYTETKLLDVL